MKNEFYVLEEKLRQLSEFGEEKFIGCRRCPLANAKSYGSGVQGGGSLICAKFGPINGYSNRGGGFDNDVKKEDGTTRLPECNLNKGEIFVIAKYKLEEEVQKELEEIEHTQVALDVLSSKVTNKYYF